MEAPRLASLMVRMRPAAFERRGRRWLPLFARDVLGWNLDLFFRQSRGLRGGASVETVHDLRVTARRLSEYLEIAQPLVPAPLSLAGRDFLNAFTRILSPIRNADVPREFLARTLLRDLSARERDAALRLEKTLLKRRERKLEDALSFWRRGQTRDRMADLAGLRRGLSRSSAAARDHFPALFEEHFELRRGKVAAEAPGALAAAFAHPSPPDLDHVLHIFRQDVRRLRYSADASRDVTGRPLAADVRRLRAVQQVLGLHHDVAVLLKRIAKIKAALSPKESRAAGFGAGLDRLCARYARMQDASLRLFRRRVQGTKP